MPVGFNPNNIDGQQPLKKTEINLNTKKEKGSSYDPKEVNEELFTIKGTQPQTKIEVNSRYSRSYKDQHQQSLLNAMESTRLHTTTKNQIFEYLQKQNKVLDSFPESQQPIAKMLFEKRNSQFYADIMIYPQSANKILKGLNKELKSFEKIINTKFIPEKLMRLDGKSEREIWSAKKEFNQVKEIVLNKVMAYQFKIIDKLTPEKDVCLDYKGNEVQPEFNVNNYFVSIHKNGEVHVEDANQSSLAFHKAYAKDSMYLLYDQPRLIDEQYNLIESNVVNNPDNSFELDKTSFSKIQNVIYKDEGINKGISNLLKQLPGNSKIQLIPYFYANTRNPSGNFYFNLIGVKTDEGYKIYNPLELRENPNANPVSIANNKEQALKGLNNIGYGDGVLIVGNENKMLSIKTPKTKADWFQDIDKVMSSEPVMYTTIGLMLVPGGGLVRGLSTGTKIASGINAFGRLSGYITKGVGYTFGAMATIDLGMAIADKNGARAISDLSVMALTLLPKGNEATRKFFLELKAGGLAVINAESLNTIVETAKDVTKSPEEKKETIRKLLITQVFFTLVFAKGFKESREAEVLIKDQTLIKTFEDAGVKPEDVINASKQDLQNIKDKVEQKILSSNNIVQKNSSDKSAKIPVYTAHDINSKTIAFLPKVKGSIVDRTIIDGQTKKIQCFYNGEQVKSIKSFYIENGIPKEKITTTTNGKIFVKDLNNKIIAEWRPQIGALKEADLVYNEILKKANDLQGLDKLKVDISSKKNIEQYFDKLNSYKTDFATIKSLKQFQLPEHYVETIRTKAWVRFYSEQVIKNVLGPQLKAELPKEAFDDIAIVFYGNAGEGGGGSLKTDADFKIFCNEKYIEQVKNTYDDFAFKHRKILKDTYGIEFDETKVEATYQEIINGAKNKNGFYYYLEPYLKNENNFVYGNKQNVLDLVSKLNSLNIHKNEVTTALYENGLGKTAKYESREIIENPNEFKEFLKGSPGKYEYIVKLYYQDNQLISTRNMKNVNENNAIWSIKFQGLRVFDFYKKSKPFDKTNTLFTKEQQSQLPKIKRLLERIQWAKTDKLRDSDHDYITTKEFESIYTGNPKETEILINDLKNSKIFNKEELAEFNQLLENKEYKKAGLKLFIKLNETLSQMPKITD